MTRTPLFVVHAPPVATRSFLRRGVGAVVAAAFLAASLWLLHQHARNRGVGPTVGPRPLPTDPWAYLPSTARGALSVDVARLRGSPALRRLFAVAASGCEQSLARGVRSFVIVVPGLPVEDFAIAAVGDLPRDALTACAIEHAHGHSEVVHEAYRGYDLTRVLSPRDAGNVANTRPRSAEIVYLPGGVVLVGSSSIVQGMVDRGIAATQGARGDTVDGLSALRHRVPPTRTLQAAAWMPDDRGNDPIEAHVRGVAVGLDADDMLDGEAVLLCDDTTGADQTAQAMETARAHAGESVTVAGLREMIAGAAIAPRGSEVHVRFSLGARALDGMLTDADGWIRGVLDPSEGQGDRDH